MRKLIPFLLILLALSSLATPFWDAETHREARRRIEQLQSQARVRPSEMPDWHSYPRFSYPHELVELCVFWDTWQLMDPDSAEHGGIIEAESGELRDVIQTDNTQEVVWDWAFYTNRSGDSTYMENIDSAWVYLGNFPAYFEEISDLGGGHTSYYYRVWNSALGLLMCKGLRDFIGGDYTGYEDSCVQVLMNDRLSMSTPWPEIDGLHALVNSFAAGVLYQWSLECTSIEYGDTALSIARDVQEWIDCDTAAHMEYIDWAMSGGTILWGFMNSVFAAMPESLDSWLSVYGPYIPDGAAIPTDYDPLIWDNSWNIWYANGFRALWAATGDSMWYNKYRSILDALLDQDRDGDGGIPASAAGLDNEDMTWISAYLLLYAMDWVIDSLPTVDIGALNPVVILPMGYATADDSIAVLANAANFGNGAVDGAHITIYKDWSVLMDSTIDLSWGEIFPPGTLWTTPGSEGNHVMEIHTYLSDTNPWNDTARVEFEATAIRTVNGTVTDINDSNPIDAILRFSLLWNDSIIVYDSTVTDSAGNYSVDLPCLSFKIVIEPEFPYWGETLDSVFIDPYIDNILNFELNRADMILVDDDCGEDYEQYYINALDSINATYRFWDRELDGSIPTEIAGEMLRHTILWFTGDDSVSTLDSSDISTLQYTVEQGGNVILCGQGICEDLSGDAHFDSLVRCHWVGSDGSPILYGVDGDAISDTFGSVVTFGSGSASNLRHRDIIEPYSSAIGWLIYNDSTYAATRWQHSSSDGKLVFVGFGLEGIGHPAANPLYTNRTEVLWSILKWFDPTYNIEDQAIPRDFTIRTYPNPFNSAVTISIDVPSVETQNLASLQIEIFDINGRRVETLRPSATSGTGPSALEKGGMEVPLLKGDLGGSFTWQPDLTLPSGVYLVRARFDNRSLSRAEASGGGTITKRIVYLK